VRARTHTHKNYTTIQAAIDDPDTLDGRTIFVEGGTYYEHVIVNKTVSLIGERRKTTIIDGDGYGTVVRIWADGVKISNFTVRNIGTPSPELPPRARNSSCINSIYHNNFFNNRCQVYAFNSYNSWDDGYPSGGNYWSDYEERYPNATEIDDSGIWNAPYVIDESNQDNYPFIPEFPTWTLMLLILTVLAVSIVIYKRRLLKTPIC